MTSKVLKKIATKLRFVYRPSKFVTLAFTVRHYFAVHRFSHILIAFHTQKKMLLAHFLTFTKKNP